MRNGEFYSDLVTTAPQLVISETARLIVDAFASIVCNEITRTIVDEGLGMEPSYIYVNNYRPSILVKGQLVLEGQEQDMIQNALIRVDTTGSIKTDDELERVLENCEIQTRDSQGSWPDAPEVVTDDHLDPDSAGGSSTTTTTTTQTGNGQLGQNAGSIVGDGEETSILRGGGISNPITRRKDASKKKTAAPETAPTLLIWTEKEKTEGVYLLRASYGDRELYGLSTRVEVRMDYTPEAEQEGKPLYVVFQMPDRSLQAYAAQYDAIQKKLVFETELLGEFVVIAFDF